MHYNKDEKTSHLRAVINHIAIILFILYLFYFITIKYVMNCIIIHNVEKDNTTDATFEIHVVKSLHNYSLFH